MSQKTDSTDVAPGRIDLYPSRQQAEPVLLDRQDPVIHSGGGAPPPSITPQQVEDYARDGFVVLRDVFNAVEVETLQEELERLRSAPHIRVLPEAFTESDNNELRSLFRVHELSEKFGELAGDPRLANIARYILNDEVYVHQSRVNLKPACRGKGFYWHSDFETWHVEDGMPRMRALSMSIALTENTIYNGSLMLMPGSHRTYVACVGETPEENYKQSLKNQYIGVPDDGSLKKLHDELGIVVPTGPPGTVTVFDCNTMHGSASNISPLPRSNVFFVYNSIGNRVEAPFCDREPRPDFIGTRRRIVPLPR